MGNETYSVDDILKEVKEVKPKKTWFSKNEEDEETGVYALKSDDLEEIEKTNANEDSYKKLFDDTSVIDEEVERSFERIKKERMRRVAQAVETAGVDKEEVENEFGVVAPMPVTSFSADPYMKNRSLDNGEEDEFQKAMSRTAEFETMEIKLNVLNDTLEVTKSFNISELEQKADEVLFEKEVETEQKADENIEFENIESNSNASSENDRPVEVGKAKFIAQFQGYGDNHSVKSQENSSNTMVGLEISSDENAKVVKLSDLFKYREKTLPVHVVNVDVLQDEINRQAVNFSKKALASQSKKTKKVKQMQERVKISETKELENDYKDASQNLDILKNIRKNIHKCNFGIIVTGICFIVLLISNIYFSTKLTATNTNLQITMPHIIINLVCLVVAIAFDYKNVLIGLKKMINFSPSGESGLAVASVAVLLQNLLAFFYKEQISTGKCHIYSFIIVLALLLDYAGKNIKTRIIYSNFKFISSREQKYAVKIHTDHDDCENLVGETVLGVPVVAYSKKASFLKRFLQISNEADPTEIMGQTITPLTLVVGMILCLITMFTSKDVYVGISVLAASCCASMAIGNIFTVNLPISKLCKKTRRSGAMVANYKAMSNMSKVNSIAIDSTDLFPNGTVSLDGVKLFGNGDKVQELNLAAAVLTKMGGTLADIMEGIVKDRKEELPVVSHIDFDGCHGAAADVLGKKVLIGNRNLLINNNVEPPERDDVLLYTNDGKKIVFIAVDGVLEAMLILSYKTDKRKKLMCKELEESGVCLSVRSTDPNITEKMISSYFDISSENINIVSGDNSQIYDNLTKNTIEKEDAFCATKGKIESLITLVTSCIIQKKNVSLIIVLQTVGVILGCVTVGFLSLQTAILSLNVLNISIYLLFWFALSIILPKFKK